LYGALVAQALPTSRKRINKDLAIVNEGGLVLFMRWRRYNHNVISSKKFSTGLYEFYLRFVMGAGLHAKN